MPRKLVILADLHLGLFGPEIDGLVYGDPSPIIERAIAAAAQDNPDHIVLLGDIVNRGYSDEYTRAQRLLGSVRDRVIPVPGNHELQRASIADFERNMGVRAFRSERICGLPAIILSSGIENLPDTEWHGELDEPQLRFLDEQLSRIAPGPLLVFVHHPIAGTVRDSEQPMLSLTNSHELRHRLERRGGPIVVFTAHTHAPSFARIGEMACLGAPALGFWPHAFITVDFTDGHLRFATTKLIDDPAASPDAQARDAKYRAHREGAAPDQSGVISLAPL